MAEIVARNEERPLWCRIQPLSLLQNFRALRKRFYVVLAGETNGAHRDLVEKLKAVGQTEVSSDEGCDYVVCFCPVASRVGTDIGEALNRIPADKPTILVVMHHTFNPHYVVADSRRLVTNPDVQLTVDTLFYEGHLLTLCQRNQAAWAEVKKYLRVSPLQGFEWYAPRVFVLIVSCGLFFRYRSQICYVCGYMKNKIGGIYKPVIG